MADETPRPEEFIVCYANLINLDEQIFFLSNPEEFQLYKGLQAGREYKWNY